MLPKFDDSTLGSYLLSVANSIHEQVNTGFPVDSTARLRECAAIVARVAQQLADRTSTGDWDARAEAKAVLASEPEFAEAEAMRAKSGLLPKPASVRRIDSKALESYLQHHPLGGRNLKLRDARLLPGGRCKLTALVTQDGAAALPPTFILRQDWQGGATDTSVTAEYALLERVSAAGICAPRPLLREAEPGALGEPFILLERMPGSISGSLFTPPRSRQLGLQLAAQMAGLHRLEIQQFRGLVPENVSRPEVLARGVRDFGEMQSSIGMKSRLIDRSIDWLAHHLPDAGTASCLTHNDLGFHNFLVEGETLSAVLDWELAALGHPAADLGYVRPFVALMLPWQDFVDAYQAGGGWAVEPASLRFHTIWNAVRLYGLIMQARSALARGLVDDVEITFACSDALMLLFFGLAAELRDADAL
jgi:aminoglycoside phosphotransferase (APT) family kinase protein